jgi:D-3-phosphoglycerate dehydrogenase / 2-oxoglutarate reductase
MSVIKATRPIIVITDADYFAPGFIEQKMPRLLELGEIRMIETRSEDALIKELSNADVAVIRRVMLTRRVLENCPRLLGIAKMGAGVENIDVLAATDNRIIVANSPAVTIAVAEAALLLMMVVVKPLFVMVGSAKNGEQPPADARGTELYGKTLGIIGFGQIGSHLGKIGAAMGMKVLVYDPFIDPIPGFQFVSLQELLRQSDFVSMHIPATTQTRHLIGVQELAMMKSTAVLVNTARGEVVDEKALVATLKEGRLRGAGIDVVEDEPLKPDNPLLKLPNVVVTPHALARTWESITKVSDMIQDAIYDILSGGMPLHALNPKVQRKASPYAETIKES